MTFEDAKRTYAELEKFAAVRSTELSPLLGPYIDITDQFGELICYVILTLGQVAPASSRDEAMRDLIADVFDFLYEARALIIKGKTELAYPMARRAYESLSLLVVCHMSEAVARRWIEGHQISNAEVRRVLGGHPLGEPEGQTKVLYGFFSKVAHPNRDTVAHRFLGKGNEFVLGSVGMPSLSVLADYALKTLDLWFWFGAFVSFIYIDLLEKEDPMFPEQYRGVTEAARNVSRWLVVQFNRVLAEEQSRTR